MQRLGLVASPLVLFLVLSPAALAADSAPTLDWTATLNDRVVAGQGADNGGPVRLSPDAGADVVITVKNDTSSDIRVDRVRFAGRVLGMSFFVYTTNLGWTIVPGEDEKRAFQLDLRDLDGQATGSIPSQLTLLDAEDHEVASADFPVTIDGSLRSVYGTFGLVVAGMTALLLISALWRLGSGELSTNRWRRAMTFAAPGLGIGFVLTFTLSALNVLVPSPTAWTLAIVLCGGIGFVIGYLTPTPDAPGPISREPEDSGSWVSHAR